MRITFKSEAWVDLRGAHELTAGDKRRLYSVIDIPMPATAGADAPAMMLNLGSATRQLNAVLANIITAWSYEFPLPKDDNSVDDEDYLSYEDSLQRIPIDDWNELEDAVDPHMMKLRGNQGPKENATITSTSNGYSRAKGHSTRRTSPRKP